MREILFRGREKGGAKWFEGDMSYLVHDKRKCYIFPPDGYDSPDRYEVDPATAGQYTGLTDKNGVKIFEGDIVIFSGMRGEIISECGAFGIGCQKQIDYDLLESKIPYNNNAYFCYNDNFISLWELWWNYEQDDNPLYEVEVIGNIYDNPELMEDKQC